MPPRTAAEPAPLDTSAVGNGAGLPADLAGSLRGLDAVLGAACERMAETFGVVPEDLAFRGLYLTADDIRRELDRPPGTWLLDGSGREHTPPLDPTDPAHGSALRWVLDAYELDSFEARVLILALAGDIDSRYRRTFAYLQDDIAKTRPTVELALRLFCRSPAERLSRRAALTPSARLVRHGIVRLAHADEQSLQATLRIDGLFSNLLLGIDAIDPRFEGTLWPATPSPLEWALPELWSPRFEALVSTGGAGERMLVQIVAPAGTGRQVIAAELARRLGKRLLVFDVDAGPSAQTELIVFRDRLRLALRQAWLAQAVLLVRGLEGSLARGGDSASSTSPVASLVARELRDHGAWVVLATERAWSPPPGAVPQLRTMTLGKPDAATRERLWRHALAGASQQVSDESLRRLADQFRLTAGQIADVVARATSEASPASPHSDRRLLGAVRSVGGEALERHARRIRPGRSFDDLVLPADTMGQLEELRDRATHRRVVLGEWGFERKLTRGLGITALFTGPSGTGKTMAAEVIAGALGVDLFAIDLSRVLSKYIGEVEQNLDRVFTAAESANGVLFFDEADSLFGKRSEVHDAHDRYANLEISYLLQKMEEFEGVAILATNLRDNLDDAFVRRIAFSVHFPFPDEHSRARLWESVWPAATPIDGRLRLAGLATLPLSGGHIRNVALGAAHHAAAAGTDVNAAAIARGVRREYQKLGKQIEESEVCAWISNPSADRQGGAT